MGLARKVLKYLLTPAELLCQQTVEIPEEVAGPVFIVGPPRSGTTLFYQSFIHRFQVGYLSNVMDWFPGRPCVGYKIQKLLLNRKSATSQVEPFRSQYGKTTGLLGPYEAGPFWYQWFPHGDDGIITGADLTSQNQNAMRRAVARLQRISGTPVVFKNVYNILRIDALHTVFPTALFISIVRNPVEIAQSILLARRKERSDSVSWWSVRPPNWQLVSDQPPIDQVAFQAVSLMQLMKTSFSLLPQGHHIQIAYKQFCFDPEGNMHEVDKFLARKNVSLKKHHRLPEKFPYSGNPKLAPDEYEHLEQSVGKFLEMQNEILKSFGASDVDFPA